MLGKNLLYHPHCILTPPMMYYFTPIFGGEIIPLRNVWGWCNKRNLGVTKEVPTVYRIITPPKNNPIAMDMVVVLRQKCGGQCRGVEV